MSTSQAQDQISKLSWLFRGQCENQQGELNDERNNSVLEREVKYITTEWSNGLENDNCDFNR